MQRIIALLLCLLMLTGCTQKQQTSEDRAAYRYGMWVTYAELDTMAQTGFKENFGNMVKQAKRLGITDLYIHVRAFCDSVYPSNIFPLKGWCNTFSEDMLQFMIDCCKSESIRFHAWINPYRVSSSEDISTLPDSSPVKTLSEQDYVIYGGIYLNPASPQARKLVLEGIRELFKYDIDGIHFDDYFYPTDDAAFDKNSYEKYVSGSKNPFSLADFRRANVNTLISSVSSLIKSSGKDIEFSISPAASISNNYEKLFADVIFWCEKGYIDTVIPQLYFGFEYADEKYCFDNLVNEWSKALLNSKARFLVGLAPYKINTTASADITEWQDGIDIVANQLVYLKTKSNIEGGVFFSYSSLFSENQKNKEQLNNIIRRIKNEDF